MSNINCVICEHEFRWSWTDTHGVAQCMTCGAPYQIFHYDEKGERVIRPPKIQIKPEYIEAIRAYWNETRRTMPGGHSFPGGQELASDADAGAFYGWINKNSHRPRNIDKETATCTTNEATLSSPDNSRAV